MKDCVFLVADTNMEATFRGFLERENFHLSLGVCPFDFDVIVESRNDPGVYKYGHELLVPYQKTHRYAVVVLDQDWDGAPAGHKIEEEIRGNLISSGWAVEACAVIVIDPELEAWIWQDSPHLETAFRFNPAKQGASLKDWLKEKELWPEGTAKPPDPKGAVEKTLRFTRIPRSSALYKQITSRVSIRNCEDPAFLKLKETLQNWFPA
jgi:hypothetical protein